MRALLVLGGLGLMAFIAKKSVDDSEALRLKLAADKAAADKAAAAKAAADKAEADRLAGMKLTASDKPLTADSAGETTKLKVKSPGDPGGLTTILCRDLVGIATPFKYQKLWMGKNGTPIGPTVSVYLLENAKATKEDFDLLTNMLAEEEAVRPIFSESAVVTESIRKLRLCLMEEKSRRFA